MSQQPFSIGNNCHFVRLTACPPARDAVYCVAKEPSINKFFHVDYQEYEDELMGNTYAYYETADNELGYDNHKLVAAFTVANSALVMDYLQSSRKNKINSDVPRVKQRRQYPALLICQLAVFDNYRKYKLGDELLRIIKNFALFLNETTACHYLIVEAVNKDKVINFYERNGFSLLYSTAEIELSKTKRKVDEEGHLKTRLMMYNMKRSMPQQ